MLESENTHCTALKKKKKKKKNLVRANRRNRSYILTYKLFTGLFWNCLL